ncbi:bZIP transcription factor 12-like [Arachis stenosperma]|uniref:bZIP transcription factor 12-like n=1 Tax=Arachis stenosperma TaxID=217475 RepID=UPI0025AC24A5|nr:bZIP transcription factor 12-like [Arachis stenosperma]
MASTDPDLPRDSWVCSHAEEAEEEASNNKAMEEFLTTADKASLQKQRRMIKNRESAARSRERRQAYTLELECLVLQLEAENTRLLEEQAQIKRQRYNHLLHTIIPVIHKRKPRPMLRRLNSLPW